MHPTPSATVAHRPLDGPGTQLTGGLLQVWQRRNRRESLPLAMRRMDTAGNLGNVRLAIAKATEGYRGPVFMDSDLYKTLEAIGWELGRSASQTMAGFAGDATALLEKAQEVDGYLNSCIQVSREPRYSRLASSHEMYCAGHLIQAALAHQRAGGSAGLMKVARRFADHLVEVFLGRVAGLDGHPEVETALAELYRQTGHGPYLRLASQFVEQRGRGLVGDSGFGRRYLQDDVPVREMTAVMGHAVRALYLEAGVVDVATETGDAGLLATSIARWDDMVATKTSLTGGVGSRHSGESFGDAFELPPDRAYNETCAAIASFHWSWRLLLATGESKYADLMERVLYNAFGAAVSGDGERFFYVNPLQRRADHYEEDDPGRRREWFTCACCPPNIMRLLASLGHYVATVADDVLHVHLFSGARIEAAVAGGTMRAEMTTDYPWSGTVGLRVLSAPQDECGLALRIPAWSTGARFELNGTPVAPGPAGRGYLVVRRRWQRGDVLRAELGAVSRLTCPSRRIDALRGAVAVERGPLVYCFEQADQPDQADLEDLALTGGRLAERTGDLPGAGPTVLIDVPARHLAPATPAGLPYVPGPAVAEPGGADSAPANGPPGPADGPPGPADGQAADRRNGQHGQHGRHGRGPGEAAVTATAVPYFQWDNRDGRPMRVWMAGSFAPPGTL